MPTHHLQPKNGEVQKKEDICLFAQTTFRNQLRRFGIKTDDRRRHMYVIGKTGMGKTTMLENMVLQDIYNGQGIGVVDPHGDFAEKIINYIPANRINDVVYFNPSDIEYPIGFNILEVKTEEQKHLVAAGLMAVFKKIWPDVWSSRMEYILNNTLLALLDYPGSTLLGINRLLSDKKYRQKVVRQLTDPVIKSFWTTEFASYEPRYQKEAVAPIQNKIGQFLSASVIRNMVAQVKSTIDIREIMDNRKILIMNLSKGRIGEDNSRLLGGMLITEIQLAAMSRVDTLEEDRKDFFLYVDEFQNFATSSFANILSEARKYRLSLIMAHQYITQLEEVVADAVFGNVGTTVTFRVGAADAEFLAKEFIPTFTEEDVVNLPKFQVFLKLMIDGVASQPFSAMTMPPIGSITGSAEKVIRVSRERYAISRDVIADKITRWSGMEISEDEDENGDFEPKKPNNREESGKNSEKNTSNHADAPKQKREERRGGRNNQQPSGHRDQGDRRGQNQQQPREKFEKKEESAPRQEPPREKQASSPEPEPAKPESLPAGRQAPLAEHPTTLAISAPNVPILFDGAKDDHSTPSPAPTQHHATEQPHRGDFREESKSQKRRRRRKQKQLEQGGQGFEPSRASKDIRPPQPARESVHPEPEQHQSGDTANAHPIAPKQPQPKPIAPDQIISFDNTSKPNPAKKDDWDDDSWRDDQ